MKEQEVVIAEMWKTCNELWRRYNWHENQMAKLQEMASSIYAERCKMIKGVKIDTGDDV